MDNADETASDSSTRRAGVVLRSLVASAIGTSEEALAERVTQTVDATRTGVETTEQTHSRGQGGDCTPIEALTQLLEGSGSVVGVVPQLDTDLAGAIGAAIDRRAEHRLIFTDRAADRITNVSGRIVRSRLDEYGVDAFVHHGSSPIGIVLVEDRAAVGLFEGDKLVALLWTADPEVRRWATDTCRRYRAASASI